MEIDGAAGVALETGVEEAGRVVKRSALGEGQLYSAFVGLARADDPVLLPHRNPTPLHRFDHIGQGLPDERPHPRQRLAAPVVQVLDVRVDLLGGGGWVLLRRGCRRLHGGWRFRYGRFARILGNRETAAGLSRPFAGTLCNLVKGAKSKCHR